MLKYSNIAFCNLCSFPNIYVVFVIVLYLLIAFYVVYPYFYVVSWLLLCSFI